MPLCITCKKQYPFGTVYCPVCGSKLVIGELTAKLTSDQKSLEKTPTFEHATMSQNESVVGALDSKTSARSESQQKQNQPKSRGGLLTAWLILMLLANGLMAFTYVGASYNYAIGVSTPLSNSISFFLLLVFAIFSIINVCATIALFKWKKWGLYACCLSSVVAFFANISLGVTLAFAGLFGLLILILLLRSKWGLLE